MKRTAIYARISHDTKKKDDEQPDDAQPVRRGGDGLGVARQEEDCRALAATLDWDVVQVFIDNDISAYNGKTRPGFEAMLDAMKNREFDALICWHTDRLYRSMKDLERLIEIADDARVPIKAVQGGELDLSTSAGRMVARILGSVSRQESEHKGERQVRANQQKAEAGIWQTANRCFGYTMTGEPLEPEATMVRKAVADVLAGKSIRRLSMEWNEAGLRTTLAGREQKRGDETFTVRGTWNGPRIRRLLLNPRYAGLKVHQGKVIGAGDWEPLIDEDTHRGLVAHLTDPSRKAGSSFERKYHGAGVYKCGVCGGPMRTAFPGGRNHGRFYACRANHVVRKGAPLDVFIEDLVIDRLTREDVRLAFDDGVEAVDVAQVRAQRAALQARLDELAALFAEGVIDGSQLRRGTSELRSKQAVLDSQLAEAARTDPVADIVKDGPTKVAENWAKATPDKRGKVIDRLMTVTVNKAARGGKGFHAEFIGIEWKTK